MKIKLLLIPAFIFGSILFVNAQSTPQKAEAQEYKDDLPVVGADTETPADPGKNKKNKNAGASENIKAQKPETNVSAKKEKVNFKTAVIKNTNTLNAPKQNQIEATK